MILSILSFVLVVLFLFVFHQTFRIYLAMRGTSNSFLTVASNDFFEKSNSLLTAKDDELPDEIISQIAMMNRIVAHRKGHWELYKFLSNPLSKTKIKDTNEFKDFDAKVKNMRPELIELFKEASVAWLNYMINKNVLCGFLIVNEFRKLQVKTGSEKIEEKNFRANIVSHLSLGNKEFC